MTITLIINKPGHKNNYIKPFSILRDKEIFAERNMMKK
jgi:hypothetical protein